MGMVVVGSIGHAPARPRSPGKKLPVASDGSEIVGAGGRNTEGVGRFSGLKMLGTDGEVVAGEDLVDADDVAAGGDVSLEVEELGEVMIVEVERGGEERDAGTGEKTTTFLPNLDVSICWDHLSQLPTPQNFSKKNKPRARRGLQHC